MKETFHGPGGTEYRQVAQTARGRVGVAKLDNEWWRVRLEPTTVGGAMGMKERLIDWRQPVSDNLRFSIVVDSDNLVDAQKRAISAIVLVAAEKSETLASLAAKAHELANAIEAFRG